MNELLKIYLQNTEKIPIEQLEKLDKNLRTTYYRRHKEYAFRNLRKDVKRFIILFGHCLGKDGVLKLFDNNFLGGDLDIHVYLEIKKIIYVLDQNEFELLIEYLSDIRPLDDSDSKFKRLDFLFSLTKKYFDDDTLHEYLNYYFDIIKHIDIVYIIASYNIARRNRRMFKHIPLKIYEKFSNAFINETEKNEDIVLYLPFDFIIKHNLTDIYNGKIESLASDVFEKGVEDYVSYKKYNNLEYHINIYINLDIKNIGYNKRVCDDIINNIWQIYENNK